MLSPIKFESCEIDIVYLTNRALTNLTVSANESIKDVLKTSTPRVLVVMEQVPQTKLEAKGCVKRSQASPSCIKHRPKPSAK